MNLKLVAGWTLTLIGCMIGLPFLVIGVSCCLISVACVLPGAFVIPPNTDVRLGSHTIMSKKAASGIKNTTTTVTKRFIRKM